MPAGGAGSVEMKSSENSSTPSYLNPTCAMKARFSVPDLSSVCPPNRKQSRGHTSQQHQHDRSSIDSIHHRHCPLPMDNRVNQLGLGSSVVHHHEDWDTSVQLPASHTKSQNEKTELSILSYDRSIHQREQVLRGNTKSQYGTHDDAAQHTASQPAKWAPSHHIGQGAILVNPIRHPARRIYFSDPERHEQNPDAGAIVLNGQVQCQPPKGSKEHSYHGTEEDARHELGPMPLGGLGLGADYNYRSTVAQLSEACVEFTTKNFQKMPQATLLNQQYGARVQKRIPKTLRQNYTVENLVSVQAEALMQVYLQRMKEYHRGIMHMRKQYNIEQPEEQSNTLEIDDARDKGTYLGLETLQPQNRTGRIATIGGLVFDSKSRLHGKLSEDECIKPEHLLRPHIVAEDNQISTLARMGIHLQPDGRHSWQRGVFTSKCDGEQDHSLRRWFSTVESKEEADGKLVPASAFLYYNGIYSVWPLIPSDKIGAQRREHGEYVRRIKQLYGHLDECVLRQSADVALKALMRSGTLIQTQQDFMKTTHAEGTSGKGRNQRKKQAVRYQHMLRSQRKLHAREHGWDTRCLVDVTPPFVLKQSLQHSSVGPKTEMFSIFGKAQSGGLQVDNYRSEMGIHEQDKQDYLQSESIDTLQKKLEGKNGDQMRDLPESVNRLLDQHNSRYDQMQSQQYRSPSYEFAHTRKDHHVWLLQNLKALNASPVPNTEEEREAFQNKKNKLLRGIKVASEEAERDMALQFKQRAGIYAEDVLHDRTMIERQVEGIYKYRGKQNEVSAEAAKKRIAQERMPVNEKLLSKPVRSERILTQHTLKAVRAASLEPSLPKTMDELYRVVWKPTKVSGATYQHDLVVKSTGIHDQKLPLVVPLPVSVGLEVDETVILPQHRVPKVINYLDEGSSQRSNSSKDTTDGSTSVVGPSLSSNRSLHLLDPNHSSNTSTTTGGSVRLGGWRSTDQTSKSKHHETEQKNREQKSDILNGKVSARQHVSTAPLKRTRVDLLRQRQGWVKTTHMTRNKNMKPETETFPACIDMGSFPADGSKETLHEKKTKEMRIEYVEQQMQQLHQNLYELKQRTDYYSDPANTQYMRDIPGMQDDQRKERDSLVLQLDHLQAVHASFYQKQAPKMLLDHEYDEIYKYKSKHTQDFDQQLPSSRQKKTFVNQKCAEELNISYGSNRLHQFQHVYDGGMKSTLSKTKKLTQATAEQRRQEKEAKLHVYRQATNTEYTRTKKSRDSMYQGLGDAYDDTPQTTQRSNVSSAVNNGTRQQPQSRPRRTPPVMQDQRDDNEFKQIEQDIQPEYIRLPQVDRLNRSLTKSAKMSQSESTLRSVPPLYYHEKYSNTPPKTKRSNELYQLSKEEATLQNKWHEHDRAVAKSLSILE